MYVLLAVPPVTDCYKRERERQLKLSHALSQRLQDLTPPPEDEATILEEARAHDRRAREELTAMKCPPCYPHTNEPPLSSVPEPQLGAVEYFEDHALYAGAVLAAQLEHWKAFRRHQERIRRSFGRLGFKEYASKVRKKWPSKKLPRTFSFKLDHTGQTMLEDWTEYRYTEFGKLENLQQERVELRKQVDTASRSHNRDDLQGPTFALDYNHRRIGHQSRLLEWIRWQWHQIAASKELRSHDHQCFEAPTTSAHGRYNLRPRPLVDATDPKHPSGPMRRSARQGHKAMKTLVRTRSGRVSKPPMR